MQKAKIPMNEQSLSSREQIELEARNWLMMLYSEDAAEDTRSEFEAWLSQSNDHACIYRKLEQAWRDLAMLDALIPLSDATKPANSSSIRRWMNFRYSMIGLLAACFAIAAISALRIFDQFQSSEPLVFASPVGEVSPFGLPDGSVVTLDSGAAITVSFDKDERRVEIDKGRVHFRVETDAARPFIVASGFGGVEVTGTAFDVWRQADQDVVAVTEGRVRVYPFPNSIELSKPPISIDLSSEQSISIGSDGQLSKTVSFDTDTSLNWRNGRFIFVDMALSDVLGELNRYREIPIQVVDEEILDFRVTMSFSVEEQEIFYQGLEATLPVRVSQIGPSTFLYKE